MAIINQVCLVQHKEQLKLQICQMVSQIPKGFVATYGQIAELAGLTGYARYVGYVLKNLPGDSKLPWHRVINSQGRISFTKGTDKYNNQFSLLQNENITLVNDKVSLKKYQWHP